MAPASRKNAQTTETGVEDTQDPNIVEGADDPSISSRAKDNLFADAPRSGEDTKDLAAEGEVRQPSDPTPQFQEPGSAQPLQVDPPTNTVLTTEGAYYSSPDRPKGASYDEENQYAAIHDADFSVEETNRKGETA